MAKMNSSDSVRIMSWWRGLSRFPGGRWLFSLILGCFAPYSGTIGARVRELRPGFARVSLRDRRKVRNHLHSIHAVALVNLGEIATGLAVLSSMTPDLRGIVTGIRAEYVKKARGTLVAEACFQLPVDLQDDTACVVEVDIRDVSGDTVTRVSATWLIGYRTT